MPRVVEDHSVPAVAAKPYWEMNAEELEAATREFNREFVADTFKPATGRAKDRNRRARKKACRPRANAASQIISVQVNRNLLEQADAYARDKGISRSDLIAEGLRAVLNPTGRQ